MKNFSVFSDLDQQNGTKTPRITKDKHDNLYIYEVFEDELRRTYTAPVIEKEYILRKETPKPVYNLFKFQTEVLRDFYKKFNLPEEPLITPRKKRKQAPPQQ